MFSDIATAVRASARVVTKLAGAAEKGASAVDHLAGWADDTAAAFADQARVEREGKLAVLNAQLAAQKKSIANGTIAALAAPAATNATAAP